MFTYLVLITTGNAPALVCFNATVRALLPKLKTLFSKPVMEQPLLAVKKKEIFELAKVSTNFYKVIVEIQVKTSILNK